MSVSTPNSIDKAAGHIEQVVPYDDKGIAGQPRGLSTLFFTELWERMSYYGMRAILILFMVAPATSGGLGWSNGKAAGIYGLYTGAVYLLSLPGGWIADRFIGQWGAVLFGGIFIASGHFTLAFDRVNSFYIGLCLIVIGTGLLKPNISAMVGTLYASGDVRRDAGFSIFYMGINIGGTIAPFICGSLAQADWFKDFLTSMGFNPLLSWHWGFAAAGVGMLIGLTQYLLGRHRLADVRSVLSWSQSIKGLGAYLGIVAVIAAVLWLIETIWPVISAGSTTSKIVLTTLILSAILAAVIWLLKDLV
ncbi:MAG: peptide MFS transporter, partial [Pyrinomonadaceae bacterium]